MKPSLLAFALATLVAVPVLASAGHHENKADHAKMGHGPATPVMVGGAPMLANKDIVDNAVNSKDHTTLVAAVKAAEDSGERPVGRDDAPF